MPEGELTWSTAFCSPCRMYEPYEPTALRRLSVRDCNEFWDYFAGRRPGLKLLRGNHWSRWRPVAGTPIFIALYLTNRSVGLFVRGERGLSLKGAIRMLSPYEPTLSRTLGVPIVSDGCPYLSKQPTMTVDRECWPGAQAWLLEREGFYHQIIARVVGGLDV